MKIFQVSPPLNQLSCVPLLRPSMFDLLSTFQIKEAPGVKVRPTEKSEATTFDKSTPCGLTKSHGELPTTTAPPNNPNYDVNIFGKQIIHVTNGWFKVNGTTGVPMSVLR